MKKLLTSILLLVSFCGFATHNLAGSINYRYVGTSSNPYRYEIIVTTYTKWVGTSGTDKCELNIHFGDGDTAIAPRINGPSVNCPTASDGVLLGSCIGSNVRYNVYVSQHDYPGTGSYNISVTDPNRSAGICNLPGSDNTPFYLYGELVIIPFLGANDSPNYTAMPIFCAQVNTLTHFDPIVAETEGDSLYFELDTAIGAGYTLPTATTSFTIDHQTGLITWDVPPNICEYIFHIRISEYRIVAGSYYLMGKTLEEVWAQVNSFGGIEEESSAPIKVFPNPSSGNTSFSLENSIEYENYQITVCNSLGQKIKIIDLTNGSATINEGDLADGIYFYLLTGDGNPLNQGKFVISQGFVK